MENHRAEEEILTVKGLSVSFTQYDRGFGRKEIQAVTDLDLRIRSGEIVAVVGASGSGKSLLAHAVMGILPYNASMSGEILFKGTPLTSERVRRLRGRELVLVPQSVTYLDPLMKTGQQLTKGRKNPEILEKSQKYPVFLWTGPGGHGQVSLPAFGRYGQAGADLHSGHGGCGVGHCRRAHAGA